MRVYSERTVHTGAEKDRKKTPYFSGTEGFGFVHFDD